jgi:hypothetical protein
MLTSDTQENLLLQDTRKKGKERCWLNVSLFSNIINMSETHILITDILIIFRQNYFPRSFIILGPILKCTFYIVYWRSSVWFLLNLLLGPSYNFIVFGFDGFFWRPLKLNTPLILYLKLIFVSMIRDI